MIHKFVFALYVCSVSHVFELTNHAHYGQVITQYDQKFSISSDDSCSLGTPSPWWSLSENTSSKVEKAFWVTFVVMCSKIYLINPNRYCTIALMMLCSICSKLWFIWSEVSYGIFSAVSLQIGAHCTTTDSLNWHNPCINIKFAVGIVRFKLDYRYCIILIS